MNDMLHRFFEAAGCGTQTELALFLGIRQSSVSAIKRQRAIPASWLLVLLRQKGVHPDWITTGKGPRFLTPNGSSPPGGYAPGNRDAADTLKRFSTKELAKELLRRVS